MGLRERIALLSCGLIFLVAGDLAAEIIRSKLAAVVHIPAGEEIQYLLQLSEALDQEIMHKADTSQNLGGMGSTLITVLIKK